MTDERRQQRRRRFDAPITGTGQQEWRERKLTSEPPDQTVEQSPADPRGRVRSLARECWEHDDADDGPQRNSERSRGKYTLRIREACRANWQPIEHTSECAESDSEKKAMQRRYQRDAANNPGRKSDEGAFDVCLMKQVL